MFEYFLSGLSHLLTVNNFIFMNIGITVGIIFGSIPGLNGNLAITILLPFTFSMNPVSAIIMLTSIFFAANFGGSISSILINTPGTNAAAATLLDGYPLKDKGYPRKALNMALVSSTIGGLISATCLLFFAPQIAKIAISFGPPEYFALAIFGLSVIASVSGSSIIKGIVSGCIGVLVSMVGMDLITGAARFTFSNLNLYAGIKLLPALLGVFAISRMIDRMNLSNNNIAVTDIEDTGKDDKLYKQEIKSVIPTILKSSFIGTFIGAIPGAGGGIASFISYNEAKRCSKKGEEFGTGELKGIAAPESANNGATAATLIPLLTLGIPGDVVAATLLGAFIMHGLIPGPNLFQEQGTIMYSIMIGIVISNIFMFIQGKHLLKYFVKITRVPQNLLTAILVVVCCTGAFSFANAIFDVYILLFFGAISYYLQKLEFPPVPIVLGIVLGPIAESNLRSALVMSGGSFSIFFTRPISLLFLLLTVILIVLLKKQIKRTA
jgi:putative tricarboxylic transport membrane protein